MNTLTPFSTPIKTEYKPLGFEAFAEPLSKMQKQYDETKAAIDEAAFKATRLSVDDERTKEILKEYETKTEELASNLLKTGNYREAALKIKQFNKAFADDPELASIKTRYDAYNKAVEEAEKQVKEDKNTETDYKLWKFMLDKNLTAGNYDWETGKYTSLAPPVFRRNRDKEIREEALNLSKMTPMQREEYFTGVTQVADGKYRDNSTANEWRSLPQTAEEIEAFLRTSDEYKDWTNYKSDLEYFYNAHPDKDTEGQFPIEVIDATYQEAVRQADYYAKQAKNKGLSKAEQEKAAAQAEMYAARADDISTAYEQASQQGPTGVYDLGKQLYQDAAQNKMTRVAYTAADLMDVNRVSIAGSTFGDGTTGPEKAGPLPEILKELDKTPTLTFQASNLTTRQLGAQGLNTKIGGSSTGTMDELAAVTNLYGKDLYSRMEEIDLTQVPGMPENLKTLLKPRAGVNPAMLENIEKTAKVSSDLYVINGRQFAYDEQLKNLKNEQLALNAKLKTAATPEEKAEIAAKISEYSENMAELRVAKADEFASVSNIVTASAEANPEMKQLFTQYGKDPEKFLNALRNQVNIDIGKDMNANTNAVQFARNLTAAIRNNYASAFYSPLSGLVLNTQSDYWTGGQATVIKNWALQNTSGASAMKRVEVNAINNISTEYTDPKYKNYDLAAYNPDPVYLGKDEDGATLLQYNLKKEYDPNAQTAASFVAKSIRNQRGLKDTEAVDPNLVKEWRVANPQTLVLKAENVSTNLAMEAAGKYVAVMDQAMSYGNAMPYVYKAVENYAPFHLLQDAKRKEYYTKMSMRINDAIKNNYQNTEIIQPPAYWQRNGDGTSTGYSLDYKVKGGKLTATIVEVKVDSEGNSAFTPIKDEYLDTLVAKTNLTNTLVAMDLLYGTGREVDIPKITTANGEVLPYVPMFQRRGGLGLLKPTGTYTGNFNTTLFKQK